jgi:hypothetical protein
MRRWVPVSLAPIKKVNDNRIRVDSEEFGVLVSFGPL